MGSTSIGVDLGYSASSVAVARKGHVEVVQNELGNRSTPSCVAIKNREPLIGTVAQDQMDSNMQNTIYGMKRMLGRQFRDITDSHHVYLLSEGNDNLPKFEIEWPPKGNKLFSPEEITSLLISKLVENVNLHIASKIEGASPHTNIVLAVPTCFDSSQRQATKDAAAIADIQVKDLHLLDEPIAAALTYGFLHKGRHGSCNLLVVDIGGGKCEASIVKIGGNEWGSDETYALVGTAGNDHLGGSDFDELLVKHFIQQDKLELSITAMQHLQTSSRSIKHKLTLLPTATIDVHLDGRDHAFEVTRETFESLCSDALGTIEELALKAMNVAQLEPPQIDDYILIGGSTRIPAIRERVKQILQWKEPNQSINPDEAIAIGAAIYSQMLSKGREKCVYHNRHRTLWIETVNGNIVSERCSNSRVSSSTAKTGNQFWTALKTCCIWMTLTFKVCWKLISCCLGIFPCCKPQEFRALQNSEEQESREMQFDLRKTKASSLDFTANGNGLVTLKVFEGRGAFEKEPIRRELVLKCALTSKANRVTTQVQFKMDTNGILEVFEESYQGGLTPCFDRKGCLIQEQIKRMAAECKGEKLRNAAKRSLALYAYDIDDKVKELRTGKLTSDHRELFTTFREAKGLIDSKLYPEASEYEAMETTLVNLFDRVTQNHCTL